MVVMEELAIRIRAGENIDQVRRDIASFIRDELEARRESLGTWERLHFANAVEELHRNLQGGQPPNNRWLMLSLVNALKACCPSDERNETYLQPEDVSWLTYKQISQNLASTGLE